MKIKSIHIYPIKGLSAQDLGQVSVHKRGLENDRRYVLVNQNKNFISQRSHPQLTQFHPRIQQNNLTVAHREDILSLNLEDYDEEEVYFSLFDNEVYGKRVSKEADQWFSDHLHEPVILVKMTHDVIRHKSLIRGPSKTEVSYADGYPILIAGTASMDLLNSKLDQELPIDRFRANIILDTKTAHVEDEWDVIRLGDSMLQVIKPCARCQVITIDQKSGTKGLEPLRVLSKYRKFGNRINFGANCAVLEEGQINIGDEIEFAEI